MNGSSYKNFRRRRKKKIKKREENTILGHTVFSTDLVSPNFTLYARRLMEHNIFFGF